ncbi:MAG: ATP-binding protein [Nocardioidaceae bacterium]
MADSLQLRVRLDAPRTARAWVCDLCRSHGLDDLCDNAGLLVTELVTNAVLHARTDCEVAAEPAEHAIRITVTDHDLADVQVHPLDAAAPGGRGLWIVAALATDWGITPHQTGKSVWFTVRY